MMELWQVRAASKILNWGKDWTWGVPSGVAYQKLLLCEREETKIYQQISFDIEYIQILAQLSKMW